MKRKGLKIFLATTMCIFNLFVCFSCVLAWFYTSNRVGISTPQVEIYTHNLDMSYRVFKYSDDAKSGIEVTGQQDALELQKYDSVFRNHQDIKLSYGRSDKASLRSLLYTFLISYTGR